MLKHCSEAVCVLLLRVAGARSLQLRAAQPALDRLTFGNSKHNDKHIDVTSPASNRSLQHRQSFSSLEILKSCFE